MTKYYVAGDGALWTQPNGPNTKPEFLGCHTLGDVSKPRGSLNLMYCRDPSKPRSYEVIGSYRSAPGPITTSVETQMSEVADYLERMDCPFPLYALKISCGRMDVFDNFERAVVLLDAEVVTEGYTNLVSRVPDDENPSLENFDIEAQDLFHGFDLKATRQSTTETEALNDVHFCGGEICEGDCGPAQSLCKLGYAVGDAAAGSPSNEADVIETLDGSTWADTGDNPFGAAEDIAVDTCFSIGTVTRIIVGRGTTDLGNPAEIAYSDDGGDTWANVNVGGVNGQYFTGPDSIFALDMYHIWAVTSGGYVYFSEDAGATWTAQESGVITAAALNCIHFADKDNGFAGGDGDVLISSTDGGDNWAAVTATASGDDILTIHCLSEYRAWCGTDGGEIYFTHDSGTTWTQRSFSANEGSGRVTSVKFTNPYVGALTYNYLHLAVTYGQFYYTINGGYSWRQVTVPSNIGLNSLFICEPYLMYAVGEVQDGTAMILKIHD